MFKVLLLLVHLEELLLVEGFFSASSGFLRVAVSVLLSKSQWFVQGYNQGTAYAGLTPYVVCVGQSLP
jgi:hypothetical protein